MARQIADRRRARERNAELASRRKRVSLEDLDAALKETNQLNLIIKGDNSGTVEALEDALLKIDVGEDVELRVIHRGVGGITEGDINLAIADNVIVLGFNVRAEGKATELANRATSRRVADDVTRTCRPKGARFQVAARCATTKRRRPPKWPSFVVQKSALAQSFCFTSSMSKDSTMSFSLMSE